MLSIDRSVITDTGSALLNSGDPVNITSIKTGSGTYTSTEDIKSRTALKSTQYSYDPTSVQVDGVNRTVSGILTNYDPDTSQAIVTSDYTITEVGLFATVNSVEVLFAIGVSYDGTEVPAFTGQNKSEIIVDWVMALSGTAQVTVSSPGAYATAADLNTHIDNQVFSASGVHGIRAVDDDGVLKIQVYDDDWGDVNGGHVIVDESDTAYPYRSNLKFYNSTIVDNPADNTTEIHVEGTGSIIVQPPTVTVETYTYNGQPQGPTIVWATGMEDKCIVTNATKTDAGTYTLTIALKNSNRMIWTDMTTADKTYSYTIAKQTLTVPTVDDTGLVYDGTAQSPTITGFDSDTMTKSGDTETDAGSYTVTFGLVDSDNYQWGGTNTVAWSIAKANQTITLSSSSVTLDSNNPTATVTVSGNQGTISASSSNTSKATVSVSGTTVTISRVGSSGSSATVTVTVTAASTTNYNSVSDTVTVTVEYLNIVSWANGTNAEIVAMVQASDNGDINLSDYWSVGDERKVTLSAMSATGVGESHASQQVTLVLMNQGLYDLVTPTVGGHSKCAFIVGLKNCLVEPGYMNNTDTNSGSWKNSKRRAWCNNVFYNAIPSSIRGIFKQFKTLTASVYNGSTNEYTNDYFALPAGKEVFGADGKGGGGKSNQTEGNALTQFDYYKTRANRIKNMNGSASVWWERSPYYVSADSFCAVDVDGSAGQTGASNICGVSPFGCI